MSNKDRAEQDSARLDWLQAQITDVIYLDDGRFIDVAGGDVRAAIDRAMSVKESADAE